MIDFKTYLEEVKRGLWANIHAKRKRIKAGSGEKMRKPGSKGAPSEADLKASQNEETVVEASDGTSRELTATEKNKLGTMAAMIAREREEKQARDAAKAKTQRKVPVRKEELSVDEQFDAIEELVMDLAETYDVDPDIIWEDFESVADTELLEYAIDAKGHKSSTGGMTKKGVDAYNRETGGNLKTAVTTPPSKLKAGSKAANRRKSFCARMSGVEGPMKDDKGRPTRKALALRKWNC